MSIGQHKLGKMFMGYRQSFYTLVAKRFNDQPYQHPEVGPYTVNGVSASDLPRAPQNAFRKRPVKLTYDKTQYQMFMLPSEKAFLMQGLDHQKIFGYRKGMDHSAHLQEQVNLDTNLSWLYLIIMGCGILYETKRSNLYTNLLENQFNSDMGHFTSEDFK